MAADGCEYLYLDGCRLVYVGDMMLNLDTPSIHRAIYTHLPVPEVPSSLGKLYIACSSSKGVRSAA